jgi:hypothetical protein
MDRKYWTLFAIAAADGEPVSPVQLQKSLFVLGAKYRGDLGKFYAFTPYNYGPFDATIYSDADELATEGLVAVQSSPRGRWDEYAVTLAGTRRVAVLRREAPSDALEYLQRIVAWSRQLSFQQLVRIIYREFPEYRRRSVFRD